MANFCSTTFITSMQCSHIYVFINGAKRVLMESYYNITGQNTVFYWNKKCFFTGKKLHDFIFDLLEEMQFFTGRFVHSHKL